MKSPTWRPVSSPNFRPPARSSWKVTIGAVGELVDGGLRVLQVAAGHDRPVVERVEEAVRLHADAGRRGRPAQHHAARELPRHGRDVDQAVHPGERRLGHDVLARRVGAGHRARRLDQARPAHRRRPLGAESALALSLRRLRPALAAVFCARLGRGLLRRFASPPSWPSRRRAAAPRRRACRLRGRRP